MTTTPTTDADAAELAWWREFATRLLNSPPVGFPMLGSRYLVVRFDTGNPVDWRKW